jgi:hypothetical protein
VATAKMVMHSDGYESAVIDILDTNGNSLGGLLVSGNPGDHPTLDVQWLSMPIEEVAYSYNGGRHMIG